MEEHRKPVKSDLAILDYEVDDHPPESLEPSSPRSRELRDFEIYNRTTLPLLVEANLRAIVESQVAPIEERVRAMVVDIVRTCQSTVARNYHLTISKTSSAKNRMRSSSPATAAAETTVPTIVEPAQEAVNDATGNSLDFFREPPHLNAEASASVPGPVYNHTDFTEYQNPSSDSGYGSLQERCGCFCHDYSNAWNTENSEDPSNRVLNLQLTRQ